ncbi:MAG TPA: TlpA disulfide reductase family protein [Chloroflexota bacterium]
MKDRTAAQAQRHQQPLTRTQRRAAERARPHQRKPQQRRLSANALVGGIVTTLAVAAIFAYAYVRNAGSFGQQGLADPNAFNPRTTLLAAGSKAPDFSLKDTSGRTYHLGAQYGHPVLLEFFALWCPVCQAEAPTIAKVTQAYERRGVRVWSVLANPYGPNYELSGRSDLSLAQSADLQWFAQAYGAHHPQLVDPTFGTVNRYSAGKYPGLYVIGRTGMIRLATAGALRYAALSHALDTALK